MGRIQLELPIVEEEEGGRREGDEREEGRREENEGEGRRGRRRERERGGRGGRREGEREGEGGRREGEGRRIACVPLCLLPALSYPRCSRLQHCSWLLQPQPAVTPIRKPARG